MHVIAIPIVHDKKKNCKKISITELWKGQFSYRKFQDYMYHAVGEDYGFDRGEMHDFGEAEKHLEVKAFKLKEAEKSLNKLEAEIKLKEQSLVERIPTSKRKAQLKHYAFSLCFNLVFGLERV